jgi:hypothetical protein
MRTEWLALRLRSHVALAQEHRSDRQRHAEQAHHREEQRRTDERVQRARAVLCLLRLSAGSANRRLSSRSP